MIDSVVLRHLYECPILPFLSFSFSVSPFFSCSILSHAFSFFLPISFSLSLSLSLSLLKEDAYKNLFLVIFSLRSFRRRGDLRYRQKDLGRNEEKGVPQSEGEKRPTLTKKTKKIWICWMKRKRRTTMKRMTTLMTFEAIVA